MDVSISPGGISTSPTSTTPSSIERVDAERQVGPAAVVGQIVGQADGLRAEAGPGPVRGSAVVGGADDHGARPGVRRRIGQVGGRHPEEGGVRPVHVAEARHRAGHALSYAAVTNSCWASAGPEGDGSRAPGPG